MTPATKQYRERAARDAQASIDRHDPAKMMESLRMQGVKFVRIQFRTLIFEDPLQLERLKVTNPELAKVFICLTRDSI